MRSRILEGDEVDASSFSSARLVNGMIMASICLLVEECRTETRLRKIEDEGLISEDILEEGLKEPLCNAIEQNLQQYK